MEKITNIVRKEKREKLLSYNNKILKFSDIEIKISFSEHQVFNEKSISNLFVTFYHKKRYISTESSFYDSDYLFDIEISNPHLFILSKIFVAYLKNLTEIQDFIESNKKALIN